MWCEVPASRQYRVRDFWNWHRNFENFRSKLQSECERFETGILSDGWMEKEQFLGTYYEGLGGGEQDSVPI